MGIQPTVWSVVRNSEAIKSNQPNTATMKIESTNSFLSFGDSLLFLLVELIRRPCKDKRCSTLDASDPKARIYMHIDVVLHMSYNLRSVYPEAGPNRLDLSAGPAGGVAQSRKTSSTEEARDGLASSMQSSDS